jgi:hypothetical protein
MIIIIPNIQSSRNFIPNSVVFDTAPKRTI